MVRSHPPSIASFYSEPLSISLLKSSLTAHSGAVFRRGVFFLSSLIGDEAECTIERCKTWEGCYGRIVEMTGAGDEVDVREVCLSVVTSLMSLGGEFSENILPHAEALQGCAKECLERFREEEDQEVKDSMQEEVNAFVRAMKFVKAEKEKRTAAGG